MAVVKNVDLKGRAGAHKGMVVLTYAVPTATEAVDQNVFVAEQAYQLVSAQAVYSGEGGSGAAVRITKCTSTQAPNAGANMMVGTFDLAAGGNINTVLSATLSATVANRRLADGDRICLDFSGTVLGVDGLAITIVLIPDPDKRYWLSNA